MQTTPGGAAQHRPVRSFVVRTGRVTPAQQRALDQYWPRYGLELADAAQPPAQTWGREAPRVLEIGFGMGDSLIDSAAAHPHVDWLGIDVYPAGIGHCLLRAATAVALAQVTQQEQRSGGKRRRCGPESFGSSEAACIEETSDGTLRWVRS